MIMFISDPPEKNLKRRRGGGGVGLGILGFWDFRGGREGGGEDFWKGKFWVGRGWGDDGVTFRGVDGWIARAVVYCSGVEDRG